MCEVCDSKWDDERCDTCDLVMCSECYSTHNCEEGEASKRVFDWVMVRTDVNTKKKKKPQGCKWSSAVTALVLLLF